MLEHILKEYSNKSKCFYSEVNYDNSLNDLNIARHIKKSKNESMLTAVQRLIKYFKAYVFSKVEDYKHEQEFRIALFNESFQKKSPITLPYNDSLVGIVLGCKFPDVYKVNVYKYANELNIKIFQIGWTTRRAYVDRLDSNVD